jgi:hypothetical protein
MRSERRNFILALVGSKCQLCGYDKLSKNLAFHHLEDKKYKLSAREFQFGFKKLLPELLKCIVVCHNCHGEIHEDLVPREIIASARTILSSLLNEIKGRTWRAVLQGPAARLVRAEDS